MRTECIFVRFSVCLPSLPAGRLFCCFVFYFGRNQNEKTNPEFVPDTDHGVGTAADGGAGGRDTWDGKTTNNFSVWVKTAEAAPDPDEPTDIPFTAKIGETALTVEKSSEVYTYTVVTEYDDSWNPVKTEERTADLYTVAVTDPAAESITLDFGEEPRLAYGYDAQGNYLSSCGAYGDGTTGLTTAAVTGAPAFVRVQTPYDSSWNSDLLYAVTFTGWKAQKGGTEGDSITVETLLNDIASSYATNSSEWNVMDMGAYDHDVYKLTGDTKQAYINFAVGQLVSGETAFGPMGASDYAKTILASTAIGVDAARFYPVNSNEPINTIEKLNSVEHSASAWSAPYVLAAYNQGTYNTEAYEQALLTAVLSTQREDGAWSEYGDSIQTTANMLAGLAFYADRPEAQTAIDKAVAYLSFAQKADGTFDAYGNGADGNTAAMVVIGLCAAGVDPDNDPRFIKGGVSALDGLMVFALVDGSGFGYSNNTTLNDYATEQGFRALIAAYRFAQTNSAYNVYDFSGNTDLVPGCATGASTGSTPSTPTGDNITVWFTIKSDTGYWMRNKSVTIPGEGATVYHAFIEALDGSGITQVGASGGYVRSMTYRGRELAEFTKGPNSGWLYKVNGELPDVGLTEYPVENGDRITFYYTNDWPKDPSAGSSHSSTAKQEEAEIEVPAFADIEGHWAAEAIGFVVEHGLFSGVDRQQFAPDQTLSRGMVAMVFYRLADSDYKSTTEFVDVADGAWYENAVAWVIKNGIATGYGNGYFGSNDNITREQLAVMLYCYAKSAKLDMEATGTLAAFGDGDQVTFWAKEAMAWAVGAGLFAGNDQKLLNPGATATRGEAAAIMQRMVKLVEQSELVIEAAQTTSTPLERAAEYVLNTTPAPSVGSIGGEWAVIGLTRSGVELPANYIRDYYDAVEDYVSQCGGVLHARKYTEYSRVVLALTTVGKDPTHVAGYDLLAPLKDFDKVVWQGNNGPIWALIAMDSGKYDLGKVRQQYVDYILSAQLEDGGWATSSTAKQADVEVTAMALTALSGYMEQADVKTAVEKALSCLAQLQNSDGTFSSGGVSNAESCAQVVMALSALGISQEDSRFVKNGNSPLDGLLTFQLENGGFRHTAAETAANQMASEQGLYALTMVGQN